MILVIDVGNTNITFGVYESKKLVTTFRMTSRTMRTSDEYGTEILAMLQNNQIDRRKVGGAIIASVVPKVMHALIGAVVRYLHTEPLIVGSGIKTGIKITSENPKEIGPDRIVDVVAAYEKYGGACAGSGFWNGDDLRPRYRGRKIRCRHHRTRHSNFCKGAVGGYGAPAGG